MNPSTLTGSTQNMASTSYVVTTSTEVMNPSTITSSTQNISSTSNVVLAST
jgi:hypothetical protein